MFFADSYLGSIDEGVANLFDSRAYPLVLVIGSLQGGDAFVAGASRIFVAYWGNVRLHAVLIAGFAPGTVIALVWPSSLRG